VIFAINRIYERSSSIYKSFTDVPVTDAGVDTVEFLEAAEGLTGMFSMSFTHTLTTFDQFLKSAFLDLLGSTAFSIVQSDLKGNITVIYISLLSDINH
jgi:hypothetical protein